MNTQTLPFDIREFMTKQLIGVCDTMLTMQAALSADQDPPAYRERVIGCVGLGGEEINGAVYLHLSAAFAKLATANMLGMTPEEISGEAEINDVVGEMTNMLAGRLKSALCDAGATCAVSTPAIIRGTVFDIEAPPEVRRELLLFDCGEDRIAVEVHIKLN